MNEISVEVLLTSWCKVYMSLLIKSSCFKLSLIVYGEQTWSYEHFDIGRPGLQDNNLTFPRLCRWDNSKSHQRNWFTSRFKDLHDDQVT